MATWLPWDEVKIQAEIPGNATRPGPVCFIDSGHECPVTQPRRAAVRIEGLAARCETASMRITALAGGVGGARFLRGLRPRPRMPTSP